MTDCEILCSYLIENPEKRCWMCLKKFKKCTFQCFKWELSTIDRRPLSREAKKNLHGGQRAPVNDQLKKKWVCYDEPYNYSIPPKYRDSFRMPKR